MLSAPAKILSNPIFFPATHSSQILQKRSARYFFKKWQKYLRYGKKRAMPTPYIKQNDMIFLSLYMMHLMQNDMMDHWLFYILAKFQLAPINPICEIQIWIFLL